MISLHQIRRPLQLGTGLLALFGIPFAIGRILGTGAGSYLIMGVTFGALLLFGGIFYFAYRWWKRGKGNSLAKMLRKEAGSSQIEGVESLRSNFEEGVEKLRKAGKNVYEIPWFLLAGQAGAGKTEAIRRSHSKEDFPPGLNDLMQGVGGTLNMNWWFANKAIILDTAGRIFEEKIKAGQSNEWLEFLKMLKRARKNMPINGFILTIPADSLIRDSIHEIEQKASHIAEQLTVVQNTLGVRFPVFVLISKTDFIPGFREFVESVHEPRLQQQMLGWSNPKHLDEPFAPEQVESYLSGVIDKLKKRRLTYMLDPHPQHGGKRLDELDALFTFPYHLKAAIPNLRRYLEIVFSLNPWSDKPLFIRGIYFTSSLQQGEALDEAIASVIGKNLGEMALSSFKRETPLFLRDMFFDKVYREYGLVTSARRVSAAMRRRAFIFGGLGLLAVGAVLAAAFYGGRSFQKQVGDESRYWQRAATELAGAADKTDALKWQQPIVFVPNAGSYSVTSNMGYEFEVGSDQVPLPDYLSQLGEYAARPLEVPAVFKPLRFFDRVFSGDRVDREKAFRRVFETSVIFPILDTSREKLRFSSAEDWSERDVAGLRALIRMQALLNQPLEKRGTEFSQNFFNALDELHYYLVEVPLGESIKTAFRQFFGPEYMLATGWPSVDQSELYAAVESLKGDGQLAGIKQGLENWRLNTGRLGEAFESDIKVLAAQLEAYESLADQELTLLQQSAQGELLDLAAIEALRASLESLKQRLSQAHGLEASESFRFNQALAERTETLEKQIAFQITAFESNLNVGDQDDPMIASIAAEVVQVQHETNALKARLLSEELQRKTLRVDQTLLDRESGLAVRLGIYQAVVENLRALEGVQLMGYRDADAAITAAEGYYRASIAAFDTYGGHHSTQIKNSFSSLGERIHSRKMDFFAAAFLNSAVNTTGAKLGFPVLQDANNALTSEQLQELAEFAGELSASTKSFMARINRSTDARLRALIQDLKKIEDFIRHTFAPEVLQFQVRLGIPAVEQLGGQANTLRSILWNARFVCNERGTAYRFGAKPVELDSMRLDAGHLEFSFQSTFDGRVGDVGVIRKTGDWVILKEILSGRGERMDGFRSASGKRYHFKEVLSIPTMGQRELSYSLTVPIELPEAGGWLKSTDLSSFDP